MDDAAFYSDNIRLATHVDDGLITKGTQQEINALAKHLEAAGLILERKGIPSKFLRLECTWINNSLELQQQKMIQTPANKYGVTKHASTPAQLEADLSEQQPDEA